MALVKLGSWRNPVAASVCGDVAKLKKKLACALKKRLCLAEPRACDPSVELVDPCDADTLGCNAQARDRVHRTCIDVGNRCNWVVTCDRVLLRVGCTAAKPNGCYVVMFQSCDLARFDEPRLRDAIRHAVCSWGKKHSGKHHHCGKARCS